MTSEFTIALHALACLCCCGDTMSSETLAAKSCTNPARVRKVMSRLGKAGLVETREGSAGGYRFSGDARAVTLRQIADALDEQVVTLAHHTAGLQPDCMIASGMEAVMQGLCRELDEYCRERLEGITLEDIYQRLIGGM